MYDRRGERFVSLSIILTAVAAAPAQKKVAAQRLSSTAAAKRPREESDNHVAAEAPRARFKSPTFALGQGMLVVVPFVDSGCVVSFYQQWLC